MSSMAGQIASTIAAASKGFAGRRAGSTSSPMRTASSNSMPRRTNPDTGMDAPEWWTSAASTTPAMGASTPHMACMRGEVRPIL